MSFLGNIFGPPNSDINVWDDISEANDLDKRLKKIADQHAQEKLIAKIWDAVNTTTTSKLNDNSGSLAMVSSVSPNVEQNSEESLIDENTSLYIPESVSSGIDTRLLGITQWWYVLLSLVLSKSYAEREKVLELLTDPKVWIKNGDIESEVELNSRIAVKGKNWKISLRDYILGNTHLFTE